jgi:hypothetical protein
MVDTMKILALFTDIEPTVLAIDKLHDMGVTDDQMDVISGIPFSHEMLGRPKTSTFIPRLAMGGAMLGLIAALFFIFGIPGLFPLHVGGQSLFPFPMFYIIAFEMIMLGLMGTAFIGLFLAGRFPSYEPKVYVPEISDGKIAVVFPCPVEMQSRYNDAMLSLGAEQVRVVEEKSL